MDITHIGLQILHILELHLYTTSPQWHIHCNLLKGTTFSDVLLYHFKNYFLCTKSQHTVHGYGGEWWVCSLTLVGHQAAEDLKRVWMLRSSKIHLVFLRGITLWRRKYPRKVTSTPEWSEVKFNVKWLDNPDIPWLEDKVMRQRRTHVLFAAKKCFVIVFRYTSVNLKSWKIIRNCRRNTMNKLCKPLTGENTELVNNSQSVSYIKLMFV